jgi:nitrite reductase/ring-hydroxylating ferredoxin subunit
MSCSKRFSSCSEVRGALSDPFCRAAVGCDPGHDAMPMGRRAILKSSARGLLVVVFAEGCGSAPLNEPADAAIGDDSGTGNGGGGAAGSGGIAGSAAVGSGVRGAVATCASNSNPAGAASGVSVGSLVLVGNGLVVGRDANGLYAMSSVCTHQGCPTNVVGAAAQPSLYCPCHGSMFGATGAVILGPARRPLQHYQIAVSPSGMLTICVGSPVLSTSRTPLP